MMQLGRTALGILLSMALVACAQAPRDPCSLIPEPDAFFGQSVTAKLNTPSGRTPACTWKSQDDHICGSASVVGPGWTEIPDVSAAYGQLTASMHALGASVIKVDDVGDEAQSVDTDAKGVMLVFRKGDKIAVTISACNGQSMSNDEFVKVLGREVAAKL
jgi:hypothetical protein